MKESEIRPADLLDRYLALSAQDGARLEPSQFVDIDCPACESHDFQVAFPKGGYTYRRCQSCGSLYCSPRPSQKQLDSLYFESESSTYWSKVFFPAVREARREKLFKPKARQIAEMIQSRGLKAGEICDIGAGHGLFLEELRPHFPKSKFYAIEPDATSAEICRKKDFEVIRSTIELVDSFDNHFDFVMSSEVVEHVFSPQEFFKGMARITKPGGHALITGLGYEGFDILMLQERSKAVSPPHHLNFMSLVGLERVFKRAGFSSVDVWTPGQLDVDIALNSNIPNEFLRVLRSRGDEAIKDLQAFLQKHKLSSHIWVLARK